MDNGRVLRGYTVIGEDGTAMRVQEVATGEVVEVTTFRSDADGATVRLSSAAWGALCNLRFQVKVDDLLPLVPLDVAEITPAPPVVVEPPPPVVEADGDIQF